MTRDDLHQYQRRAANFIALHTRCILSVDMGLGKTAATLAWLEWKRPQSCVIVAPKRVAENNWRQEAEKWNFNHCFERMTICAGTSTQREKAITDDAHPYKIISRDNLKDVRGMQFDVLIIDELTSFKNSESARSKYVRSIRADIRIGLTGTFIANGAVDIYGQADAVGLAERWNCPNFYAWRGAFFDDVLKNAKLSFHKWKLIVTLEKLLAPIADSIFTLTAKDYLSIPPVTETTHAIECDEDIKRNIQELDAFLATKVGDEFVAVHEKAKFAKLQTLVNGFVYVKDDEDNVESVRSHRSAKLEAVADFIADCKEAGESVLLFYAYREEALWLSELLAERGVKFESVKKQGFVERWNAHETECLFAHPASAGHGLNLQHGGRVIVWSTMTYNYELFAQGNARLARQGQRGNVQIHYFVGKDTCEEQIVRALQRKQGEQDKFLALTKQ